ncbi:MAG: glycogen synthase GlgA [Candidatus Helarchaeota archaeon]
MKILFVTSELVPYIKIGGLADVSAALPKALEELGHEVRIILPKYTQINLQVSKLVQSNLQFQIPLFKDKASINISRYPDTNITIYFVKNEYFYNRAEVYGDYADNAERAIFFSKVVLELCKHIDWTPDIIHCNDWQTALIPILLKYLYQDLGHTHHLRTLFTIHNLAYQGIFPKEKFRFFGLPLKLLKSNGLEFWGKLNFLKAGILYADLLNTVSERYALEIQTKEYGCGLEQFLQYRKSDLYGIMNGIDYTIWDPRIDRYIWANYGINSIERKMINKLNLQKMIHLPQINIPLFGIISRLVDQKGIDLIQEIFPKLMKLPLQLVLLGTGLPKYHEFFKEMANKYSQKIAVFLKFDEDMAHKIEAGSDFFLMPSKYEPCGLNQLISLRYGTLPIVHYTGGLADSIHDIDFSSNKVGVGFVFKKYQSKELLKTIKRAINFYRNIKRKEIVMRRAMQEDFSWTNSARKYVELYQRALQKN